MTMLEWRDEYRIGIEEVDAEHQALIDMINGACRLMDPAASNEGLELALGEIHAVCTAHFALEEKDMRLCSYPQLAEHKADHERLLDDIRDLMDSVAMYGVLDRDAFSLRLTEWFGIHFRTHDARLHTFLAGLEKKGSA